MNRYLSSDLGDHFLLNPPMQVHESYQVHDNGGRPFLVEISEDQKQVQIRRYNYGDIIDIYDPSPCLIIHPTKVFIGEDPNYYNESYPNPDWAKGNSILLRISGNRYMFVGQNIMTFESVAPITEYCSPVGNSNVPYPFAIDQNNNYYLMIEEVFLQSPPIVQPQDPYEYYYSHDLIGPDIGCVPPRLSKYPDFRGGISSFGIGSKTWTLRLKIKDSGPNYDRLTSNARFGNVDGKQVPTLYFRDPTKTPQRLTRQDYIDLMKDFAQLIGAKPIPKTKTIVQRMW